MRRPFVAGNWKMNTTLAEGRTLIRGLRETLPPKPPIDVAVCPPFVYLLPACREIEGTPIRLGAQDCYCEAKGAFTGEVSAGMLRDAGIHYEELVLNRDYTEASLRAVSDRATVPQVFINGSHIGGSEDLEHYLAKDQAA